MFKDYRNYLVFAGLLSLILGLSFTLRKSFMKKNKSSLGEPGTIIVLNGPSGSGKSSIQKEFQKLMMPNLWIKLGIDNLFDQPMPDITPENMQVWQAENPIRWVESSEDNQGNTEIALHVGLQGEQVMYGMHSAIAAYAENGCNIIVDYIAYKEAWFADLQKKLDGFQTYYVGVEIPLDILEQREARRGTSPVGHARSHYDYVLEGVEYDLLVNTHTHSSREIAEQIKNMIEKK